jgi:hypothetical protein
VRRTESLLLRQCLKTCRYLRRPQTSTAGKESGKALAVAGSANAGKSSVSSARRTPASVQAAFRYASHELIEQLGAHTAQRGTTCVSQEFPEEYDQRSGGGGNNIGERIGRVEILLAQLVQKINEYDEEEKVGNMFATVPPPDSQILSRYCSVPDASDVMFSERDKCLGLDLC